ncbi:hypothetical protein BC826DRAFT_1013580, partial [Russula brevipes]
KLRRACHSSQSPARNLSSLAVPVNMSFPPLTCKILQEYSTHPPENQDLWLGPWMTILTTLFPPTDDYIVSPQIKTYIERGAVGGLPDLVIEVAKYTSQPFALRTILIVEIKNAQHWPDGVDHMLRRIDIDTGYDCIGLRLLALIGHMVSEKKMSVEQDRSLSGAIRSMMQLPSPTFRSLLRSSAPSR